MIWLLFGEMGVGKNYVGERLARHLGCPFFDGDDVIPDWMMWKIEKFRILSLGELDRYTSKHLIPAIYSRHELGKDLVVAQALYRRRHRRMILEGQGTLGSGLVGRVVPVWLKPPSTITHAKRLLGREHGFSWLVYALVTKPFFQKPDKGTAVIVNETGGDLSEQFRRIVGR